MGGENRDENRDGNGKGRPAWTEQDREREKGEAGASGVGSGERRTNSRTLLGDVQEYWRIYAGEGADTIWDLQYS